MRPPCNRDIDCSFTGVEMTTKLRISTQMIETMLADLRRPHAFAYERVGFLYCKQSALPSGHLLLAIRYEPIRDDQYIEDTSVGARFDSSSIRTAMQVALSESLAALHVHLHDHRGVPGFSSTDRREMQALMPCFVNLCPDCLHGAIVLSCDSAIGRVWATNITNGRAVDKITFVGPIMKFMRNGDDER